MYLYCRINFITKIQSKNSCKHKAAIINIKSQFRGQFLQFRFTFINSNCLLQSTLLKRRDWSQKSCSCLIIISSTGWWRCHGGRGRCPRWRGWGCNRCRRRCWWGNRSVYCRWRGWGWCTRRIALICILFGLWYSNGIIKSFVSRLQIIFQVM